MLNKREVYVEKREEFVMANGTIILRVI
jgi:hypothetical protein